MDKDQSSNQDSEKNQSKEDELSIVPPENKVNSILERLELSQLTKGRKSAGFDFSSLSDQQKDRVLDLLEKNEDNAFKYHEKRLSTIEKLQSKAIESQTVNQRTIRYIAVGAILSIPILTILILFFKEDFFIPWLTFLTGLAGGAGISKASKYLTGSPNIENPLEETEEEQR